MPESPQFRLKGPNEEVVRHAEQLKKQG